MPTAQATQAAVGQLRAGASLTTKLALELPHPVADKATCRQGCGIGVGSWPQLFVDKKPGELKADGRNRGQRTKIANERDRDRGIAIITKPLLPFREDEARSGTKKRRGSDERDLVRSRPHLRRARPAIVFTLPSSLTFSVVDVKAKGREGRARSGSFSDSDSATVRPVKQPQARSTERDEIDEEASAVERTRSYGRRRPRKGPPSTSIERAGSPGWTWTAGTCPHGRSRKGPSSTRTRRSGHPGRSRTSPWPPRVARP